MWTFDWKVPFLVAVAAALPMGAVATPVVQVTARANINLNPFGTVCRDGFDQRANVAAAACSNAGNNTTTGSPYELSAATHADASDLGHLRLSGSAHALGRTGLPAMTQTLGSSSIDVQDLHHFSASGLEGQAGVVTATLLVTGNLSAWADSTLYLRSTAGSNWYLEYSTPSGTLLNLRSSHEFLRSDWIRDSCVVDFVYAPCAETLGLFSFDIPFIWGQDLPFLFRVSGGAVATTLDDGLEANAAYDFGHSFVWGGFSNVRAGSTEVTSYDYRSGTGHDWRVSSIDNGPSNVPEPATTSLAALALGSAWCARRRRGA